MIMSIKLWIPKLKIFSTVNFSNLGKAVYPARPNPPQKIMINNLQFVEVNYFQNFFSQLHDQAENSAR